MSIEKPPVPTLASAITLADAFKLFNTGRFVSIPNNVSIPILYQYQQCINTNNVPIPIMYQYQ
jgi:hypothetical protein